MRQRKKREEREEVIWPDVKKSGKRKNSTKIQTKL